MRVQLALSLLAILFGFYRGLDRTEWALIVVAIGLVLAAESMNTAIEKLADALHPGHDPKIGLAKDIAAGGVLVAAITAAILGGLVFFR